MAEENKEIKLKAEDVEKWDRDFVTIDALNKLSISHGDNFVVKGGLATEIYLGGIQKRAHGDIDATYYILSKTSLDQLSNEIDSILKLEETHWKKYDSPAGKIEYREAEDEREFFERRRLELYVRQDVDEAYETGEFQTGKLFDSKGNVIEVKVMDLSELIAMKVRNIFMSENKIGEIGRPSSETDYSDLDNLLKLTEHNKNKTIDKIAKILMRTAEPDEAKEKAIKEYDFVVNLLLARRK